MKIGYSCFLFLLIASVSLKAEDKTITLTLKEAILMAQHQSVDAAVVLNELKSAYWEYRTHKADQLPEVSFTGTLPAYSKQYNKYLQSDGSYTYLKTNTLGLSGEISVVQNVALTGGTVSLNTSMDFSRQLSGNTQNEFMSVPIGVTFRQPIFGVNVQKWKRRIEPVRYQEAKASYIEDVEGVTIKTISYFFDFLLSVENKHIAEQNYENAVKLHDIAVARRKIGHISESELMQLNLAALQAKGDLTEAQSALNASLFQLRAFLGLSESDVLEPALPESVTDLNMDYQLVLTKAQENNSFARNILRRQLEADYAVATAKGNRRSINLFASIGYTGKDRMFRNAYTNLSENQIVEVGVSVPLLDWGKRKGKVKVAESNRDLVLSRTKQEQMNFNQDIFLLVEKFNNQAAQLKIAEEADRIAQQRYNMAVETFMIGKINILDLNDARNSKDDARRQHIQQLYLFWNYYYNVRSVTLYDFMNKTMLDADIEEIVLR